MNCVEWHSFAASEVPFKMIKPFLVHIPRQWTSQSNGNGAPGSPKKSGGRRSNGNQQHATPGASRRPTPRRPVSPHAVVWAAAPQSVRLGPGEQNEGLSQRMSLVAKSARMDARATKEMLRDKGGVVVTERRSRDAADVLYPGEGASCEWTFVLENTSTKARQFVYAHVAPPRPEISIEGSTERVALPAGESMEVVVRFTPSAIGRLKQLVIFKFVGFQIGRFLTMTVAPEQDLNLLAPSSAYDTGADRRSDEQEAAARRRALDERRVVHTMPALTEDVDDPAVELAPYPVPPRLIEFLNNKVVFKMDRELTADNFRARLHNLLYLEEYHQLGLMAQYEMHDVAFELCTSYVVNERTYYPQRPLSRVAMDGLAEKRPSVMPSDRIYAWTEDGDEEVGFGSGVFLFFWGGVVIVSWAGCRISLCG